MLFDEIMEEMGSIHTARMVLRPLAWQDILFFYRLHRDKNVRRYLGGQVVRTNILRRFVQCCGTQKGAATWVARPNSRQVSMGLVEFGPHKNGHDWEVSYQFLPKYWGNGWAREAVYSVIESAFESSSHHRIIAETQSANHASCRLLKALDMIEIERIDRFGAEQIIWAKSRAGTS